MTKQNGPCSVCGRATKSKYRICSQTIMCRQANGRARSSAYNRGETTRGATVPCKVCGQDTMSRYSVCYRTRECRRVGACQWRGPKICTYVPCGICGEPTRSKTGLCLRTLECRRVKEREMYRRRVIGLRLLQELTQWVRGSNVINYSGAMSGAALQDILERTEAVLGYNPHA